MYIHKDDKPLALTSNIESFAPTFFVCVANLKYMCACVHVCVLTLSIRNKAARRMILNSKEFLLCVSFFLSTFVQSAKSVEYCCEFVFINIACSCLQCVSIVIDTISLYILCVLLAHLLMCCSTFPSARWRSQFNRHNKAHFDETCRQVPSPASPSKIQSK